MNENDVQGVPAKKPSRAPALTGPNAQAPAAGQTPAPGNAPDGFTHHGLPLDGAWNWPEDYEHDNGQYMHKCSCGRIFHGYKRRVLCKVCDSYNASLRRMAEGELSKFTDRVWSVMGLSGDAHRDLRQKDYRWGFIEGFACAMARVRAEAESPQRSEDLKPQTDGDEGAGTPKTP